MDHGVYAYVWLDNLSACRVAGDLMGRLIGRDGGDVVVVSDVQNIVALEERVVGFRAALPSATSIAASSRSSKRAVIANAPASSCGT